MDSDKSAIEFRDEIIQKLAENLRMDGMELIDAQTNEPVIKMFFVPEEEARVEIFNLDAEQTSAIMARCFGTPTTTNLGDGTFRHTFK